MSFIALTLLFLLDLGLSVGKWAAGLYFAYIGFIEHGLIVALFYFVFAWGAVFAVNFLLEFLVVPAGWILETKHGVNGRFTYKAARYEAKSRRRDFF